MKALEPPAGAADPVGQSGPVDLDALAGEDLALPVERQVIAVFGRVGRGVAKPWRPDVLAKVPGG